MKMTMHIDEHLLQGVMEKYDFETKTDAVNFALKELDRREKLRAFMREGLGFTPEELKAGVYADYDLESLRAAEAPGGFQTDTKKKR